MKVVTFGEVMLRLAPHGYLRFEQAQDFQVTYGGGEANVAVSLVNYGIDASFVTKLPNNEIAQAAINELRGLGVDTSHIARGGERMGIYYLEKGASQRPSKVIYDRAHSSISTAAAADFDWDAIFEGVDWFHFTGITPALGANTAAILVEACKAAQAKHIKISCDLNYRKKLWTTEEAQNVMTDIAQYIDVLIANEEDAEKVYGIHASGTHVDSGSLNHDGYVDVAQKLTEKFGFEYVAITLRESLSANDNRWAALLYHKGKAHFSPRYDVHIVDRVGGGDSFGGGLIYALLNHYEIQAAIDFAVAASCLKHSIEGDYNRVTRAEVEALVGGDGTGRVQR